MALIHLEGFDKISGSTGTASATDVDAWLSYSKYYYNTAKVDDYLVFDGWGGVGHAMSMGDGTDSQDNFLACTIPPHHTVITGFAFKPSNDAEERDDEILCFGSVSENLTDHFTVQIDQGKHLKCFGNGAFLATAKNCLFKDKWNYIELKIVFGGSGSFELKVNEVSYIVDTSVATSKSGSTSCDTVTLHGLKGGNTSSTTHLYDDWYIIDETGSSNNDFLGAVKVETLMPSAAGDSSNFTPSAGSNFENVDETPIDTTTYNESLATSGNKDLFNIDNLSTISGDVKGVQVTSYAISTEGQVITVEGLVKSSITENNAGTFYVGSDVYQPFSAVWETDPALGGSWLVGNINTLQIGYEVS